MVCDGEWGEGKGQGELTFMGCLPCFTGSCKLILNKKNNQTTGLERVSNLTTTSSQLVAQRDGIQLRACLV